MEVIFGIILVIIAISIVIAIINGIIYFFENHFYPFFVDAGMIITYIAVGAIAIAIAAAIVSAIVIHYRTHMSALLRRQQLILEIHETEKAVEAIMKKTSAKNSRYRLRGDIRGAAERNRADYGKEVENCRRTYS